MRLKIDLLNKETFIQYVCKVLIVCGIIVLFAYFIIGGYIGYETNDDLFMSAIPAGWYGKYYPYTIYSNIIVGYILAGVSSLAPMHNWTTIFSLAIILFSYLFFGSWCIEKKGELEGSFLSVIFVLTTWIAIINRYNFTKCGSLAITVGVVALLGNTKDKKEFLSKKAQNWFAAILIVIGGLFRYETSLVLLPFLLLGIIYLFKNHEKRTAIVLIGIIAVSAFLWLVDYWAYHSNPEWRDYKNFNKLRGELLDYSIPEYQTNRQIFDELGLSETDYKMLSSWQFADDNTFNEEVFVRLIEYRDKKMSKSISDKLKISLQNMVEIFSIYKFLYVVLLMMILSIWNTQHENRRILLLCFFLWIAEVFYICYQDRAPERAIFVPSVMCLGHSILFYCKKKYNILLSVFALVFVVATCGWINRSEWNQSQSATILRNDSREMFQILSKQGDKLFVWNIGSATYNLALSHDCFSSFEPEEHSNSVYTGGWFVQSPIMSNISGKYGEKKNVFKLLAYNPDVFYISFNSDTSEENIKLIEEYIREHYSESSHANKVGDYGVYTIYSFYNSDEVSEQ